MNKPTFSIRLVELRNSKGLTQQQVADKIELSRARLNNYEQGIRQPDIDTTIKLANFYNVTTDYILGKLNNKTDLTPTEPKKPKDLKRILEQHEIMFDGVPIDEDAKKEIMHIVEFELYKKAKELNKRKKATPDS